MRILFTNLLLFLAQPPQDPPPTQSSSGQLVGRGVFLTFALPSTPLFLIDYKILKNAALVRNNQKSSTMPKRDKSVSEREPDLFMEFSLHTQHLKQLGGRLNLATNCSGFVYLVELLFLYSLGCPLVCTRRDVLWLAPADKGNYSISRRKHAI